MKWKLIAIFIIGFLVGAIIGGVTAAGATVNYCVDLGLRMLKEQKVTVDLDKQLIEDGLWRYRTKIEGRYLNVAQGYENISQT